MNHPKSEKTYQIVPGPRAVPFDAYSETVANKLVRLLDSDPDERALQLFLEQNPCLVPGLRSCHVAVRQYLGTYQRRRNDRRLQGLGTGQPGNGPVATPRVQYFGVCTRGRHIFSLVDKTLIGGTEPVDITYQHIDSASEPQLRAGAAEKCSAALAKVGMLPVKSPCVWVSDEVANYETLEAFSDSGSNFALLGATFDVSTIAGSSWLFPTRSRFTPIGPK